MRHFFWRYQSCCPKCIGVDTEKGNNRDIEEFDSVLTRLENRSVHFHNQKWINSQKILKKDKKTPCLTAAWKTMVEFWSH